MKHRASAVAILTCALLWPGLLCAEPGVPVQPANQDHRVFVDLNQVPPILLLKTLAVDISCKLDVEGTLPDLALSLRISNVRARTALDAACDMIGCRWRIEGQSLRIEVTTPLPPLAPGRQFEEMLRTPLRGDSWSIEQVEVGDVLRRLSDHIGVPVVADNAEPSARITVDLRGRAPSEAFSLIQRALGWKVIGNPGKTYVLLGESGPTPLKPRTIHLTGRMEPDANRDAGAVAGRIFATGESGVVLPRIIKQTRPQYTSEARRAKIQGVVTLDLVVDTDGTVADVTIVKSLDAGLDEMAVEAVRQWRFMPGLKDGKPVSVRVEVEMTFTLR